MSRSHPVAYVLFLSHPLSWPLTNIYSATEHRITHTIGSFIEYQNRDNDDVPTIARLDYLFVHEYFNEYRLLVIVTDTTFASSSRHDPVLGLPIMHVSRSSDCFTGKANNRFGTRTIGLPVITSTRPYVVPVIERDGEMELDQDVIYSKEYSESGSDKALVYCNAWEAVSL